MKSIKQHMAGTGAAWTKKYPPVKIEKIISNVSAFDEYKFVKMYMAKYGIDKVRGGAYIVPELDTCQKPYILEEIRGSLDVCTICGSKNHLSNTCPQREYTGCLQCGRLTHESITCQAVYDVNGIEIEERLI